MCGCLHTAFCIESLLIFLSSVLFFLREPCIVTLTDFLKSNVLIWDVIIDPEARVLQALEYRLLVEFQHILEQVVTGLQIERIFTDHFRRVQRCLLLLKRFLYLLCWVFWLQKIFLFFYLGQILLVSLNRRACCPIHLLLNLRFDLRKSFEMAISPWHVVERGRWPVYHR